MIAVDTNLLVYAHRAAVPQHRRAQRALERAAMDPGGWGTPLPCIAEFWMVVTHPSATGRPSTPEEAGAFVYALQRDGRMEILEPMPGSGGRLMHLATHLGVTGPRIFDLQIGLCALQGGATELWSHDRGFMAPPGLRLVDPLTA